MNHDPSWNHYPATILEIGDSARILVDLRRPVDPRLASSFELTGPFGVVTVWTPNGRLLSQEENERRDAHLRARIEALSLEHVRAVGRSPTSDHGEPGYAIAGPLSVMIELAREFEQSAVFWFDGRGFNIIPQAGPKIALPMSPPT